MNPASSSPRRASQLSPSFFAEVRGCPGRHRLPPPGSANAPAVLCNQSPPLPTPPSPAGERDDEGVPPLTGVLFPATRVLRDLSARVELRRRSRRGMMMMKKKKKSWRVPASWWGIWDNNLANRFRYARLGRKLGIAPLVHRRRKRSGGGAAGVSEDVEDLEDEAVAKGAVAAADPELPGAEPAEGVPAGDERRPLLPHHAHAALRSRSSSSSSVFPLLFFPYLQKRRPPTVLIRLLQQRHQRHSDLLRLLHRRGRRGRSFRLCRGRRGFSAVRGGRIPLVPDDVEQRPGDGRTSFPAARELPLLAGEEGPERYAAACGMLPVLV